MTVPYALSWEKMEGELGWTPAVQLETGLRDTIRWYQTNSKWVANVRGGEYRSYYDRYYVNRDASLESISRLPARQ